jgi:hypothetical protein
MLVTMQNSDLINKLLLIADGDIELVQTAIRASAGKDDEGADLKKVVQYIVSNRKRRILRPAAQHVAA